MFKHVNKLAALLIFIFMLPSGVHAGQCVDVGWNGTWKNTDQNTRGITQLNIRMECRDATEYTENSDGTVTIVHAVKAVYHVNTRGKCHPTDCRWGSREGHLHIPSQGYYQVKAKYDQGFADKFLTISKVTRGSRAGQLKVRLYNRFKDNSGRRNYVNVYYLAK
jgi:hypothetical protein